MTDKELLDKAVYWFKVIADDMEHITSGNLPHCAATTKGRAIRAYEFLEKYKDLNPSVYVVTRCEEHSDYVEKVFYSKQKANEYCIPFNNDENSYHRDITEVELTV